ncbi:MAG: AmmeMemoRadiSam system radical SAM enzyme [Armatimonadota bacterium]
MIEALLYEKMDNDRARCNVCQWHCVIAPGKRGACSTRENLEGTLYTLIYDQVSSANLDPIEKKPLYHFHPGTPVFSLGTLGCSFTCPGCQNWQISQREPREIDPMLNRLTPAAAVAMAERAGAEGICWTYNEPAIWLEHTLEGARLAKEAGLYTAYVTNGTATREQLDLIGPYLDAYRVDIKAFSREGYRTIAGFANFEGILEHTQYARERWGMHVECVTNVTPTINDSDDILRGIAEWIASALGADTPWHVTRFFPYQGFDHLPATPLERLDRAGEIGREAGLQYIYVGNVPGDPRQDTHCPACGHTVIRRRGFSVAHLDLADGACPRCQTAIAGRWDG